MKLEYDPEVDSAYLTLRAGKVARSKKVSHGVVLDLDRAGDVLGIEVVSLRKRSRKASSPRPRRAQRVAA
jgi:uncharacterized protein YuzE